MEILQIFTVVLICAIIYLEKRFQDFKCNTSWRFRSCGMDNRKIKSKLQKSPESCGKKMFDDEIPKTPQKYLTEDEIPNTPVQYLGN